MRISSGKVVSGRVEIEDGELEEGASVTVLVCEGDESFELSADLEEELLEALEEANSGQLVDGDSLLEDLRR